MTAIEQIAEEFKKALARKLTHESDGRPEQIDLTLAFEGKQRKVTILVLETDNDE